jgi:hypothetical protein
MVRAAVVSRRRGQLCKLSVAPMMKYTDRHFRAMMRALTRQTLLYTGTSPPNTAELPVVTIHTTYTYGGVPDSSVGDSESSRYTVRTQDCWAPRRSVTTPSKCTQGQRSDAQR